MDTKAYILDWTMDNYEALQRKLTDAAFHIEHEPDTKHIRVAVPFEQVDKFASIVQSHLNASYNYVDIQFPNKGVTAVIFSEDVHRITNKEQNEHVKQWAIDQGLPPEQADWGISYSPPHPSSVMNEENYNKMITDSMQIASEILHKPGYNYRILGSLLIAALNGKPHRRIGDIDVVLEKKDLDTVLQELQKCGYVLEHKETWRFRWIEANHPSLLGFTFLLVGDFCDDGFRCPLSKHMKLRISHGYLKPTSYTLFGIDFTGIPPSSIFEGLKISNLNPKRTLDKEVMYRLFKDAIPTGEKLDNAFTVYIGGMRVPKAYSFFSSLYNIYGGIRVRLGQKYEIWD